MQCQRLTFAVALILFMATTIIARSTTMLNSEYIISGGSKEPGDKLLCNERIKYKALPFYQLYKIRCEQWKFRVGYLYVINNNPGNEAGMRLFQGGLGQNHVLMHFSQPANHSIDFSMKVYGVDESVSTTTTNPPTTTTPPDNIFKKILQEIFEKLKKVNFSEN